MQKRFRFYSIFQFAISRNVLFFPQQIHSWDGRGLVVGNGDLNLYSWLNVDGCDLTHDLWWWVQVNDALVDSHLEGERGKLVDCR